MAGKNYDINFRIKTDASKSRKELGLTAREFRDFNKTVRASQTPMDRFEKDLSDLNKAFKLGAITLPQYNHRLEQLNSRYNKVNSQQKKVSSGLSKMAKGFGAFAAGYATLSTLENILGGIANEMERIDKIGKTASGIGASTEFLSELEFIAQRTSGLEVGAATKGIEKMTRRLAEAATGTGEAVKALEMLGIEAKALAGLSPEEQFRILSRAMDSVTDSGKRTLIATKLFDDEQSKLQTTMALTNSEYQEQAELAKQLGLVVIDEEAKKAAAFQDSKQAFDASYNSLKRAASVKFSPELTEKMDAFTEVLTGKSSGLNKAALAGGSLSDIGSGMAFLRPFLPTSLGGRKPAEMVDDKAPRVLSKQEIKAIEKENAEARQREFNKTWAEAEKKRRDKEVKASQEAARQLTRAFTKSFRDLSKVSDIGPKDSFIGKMLGRGLATGINSLGDDQKTAFQAITADPYESITAGSSEAFRIQNQNTSFQSVEVETNKKTEKNTATTADNTGTLVGIFQNATGLGL